MSKICLEKPVKFSEDLELCRNEITLAALLENELITIKTFDNNDDLRLEISSASLKNGLSKNLFADIEQIVEKLELIMSNITNRKKPVIIIRDKKQ